MSLRWLPPVASPVAPRSLVAGAAAAASGGAAERAWVEHALRERFDAADLLLADSGTSALVLALRLTAGADGVVALPAWGCIDLSAAAAFAGVRVRLYDVDPVTLSPDLDSLAATLERGVSAVVVAHFFGYPADVPAVRTLAARHGVPVIEDAAQAAGGALRGARLGALGDLSVLSFGRGKGTTGGSGGALLVRDPELVSRLHVAAAALGEGGRGAREVAVTAAQWVLGRPAWYRLPASLPGLKLGEMVYHPAHEPRAIARAACAILRGSLALDDAEASRRRGTARTLEGAAAAMPEHWRTIRPVSGARPGCLRLPVVARVDDATADAALGIVRPYPLTLDEHAPLAPYLLAGERAGSGVTELSRRLVTLPTHSRLTRGDVDRLGRWLRARGST